VNRLQNSLVVALNLTQIVLFSDWLLCSPFFLYWLISCRLTKNSREDALDYCQFHSESDAARYILLRHIKYIINVFSL